MKKCKAFRSLLLAAIIVNFCFVLTLFSQETNLLNHNSFNEVILEESGEQSTLVFRGVFKSLNIDNIAISQAEGSNRVAIKVLNSLWDTIDVPSGSEQFGADKAVQSVDINNEISMEPGEEGFFAVVFNLTTNGEYSFEVGEPIENSELKILVKDKVSKAVSEPVISREMQEATKIQQEIEQRKQEAQMTANESVQAILQQYRKPSAVQVAIFNASGYAKRAYGLSVYLSKLKREHIEESLGMKMEIVNISNAQDMNHKKSTIYFRANYLKPALFLANLIKGDQRVMPLMDPEKKMGVDIEIFLGKDYE